MGRRKRDLRWRGEDWRYFPPDIENSAQLLQVIRTGVATYRQVTLYISDISDISGEPTYWAITTPDLHQTVRPWHMLLLVKRSLVDLYNMSSKEFLAQHALGTLQGQVTIGFVNPSQLGLGI